MPPRPKASGRKTAIARPGNEKSTSNSLDGAATDIGWIVPDLDYPSFRLALTVKVMDRLTVRQLRNVAELTYPEWRTLSRLCMSDGLAVRQIAELAWADRAEVSRAAASLEKRGLTGRREDPLDRRTPILFCTAKGRTLYRRTIIARARFHETVLSELSDTEKRQLDKMLKKITGRLFELLNKTTT
jgi:DNA-binding MarR family transcriptional regulator